MENFIKNFEEFEGLDLTSSDLSRNENFASVFQNWDFVGLKSIRGRRGNKQFAFHAKGGSATVDQTVHGIASYRYLIQNQTTVKLAEKLLLFYGTSSILTLTTGSVNIAYAGAFNPGKMSILLDAATSTYKAYFYANSILVNTLDLGNGDASSLSLASFISTVDGYADWTCTLTSPTTFPTLGTSTTEPYALEAFELMQDLPIATSGVGGTEVAINYFDVRNSLRTKFTSGSTYNNFSFNNGQGQAISTLNKNNVLYIASGRRLMKWDGMNFYDAGLPFTGFNSIAASAGAGLTAGTYKYRIRWHFKDFQQNDIYGDYVEASVAVAGGNLQTTFTAGIGVINLGWNTKFARVNGVQAGVTTITVDAGYDLEVGDPVYFYDTAAAVYVERYITAVAATTITISGAVVSVADNAPISCNLRLEIGRTASNGVDFYVLDVEPPYDPSNITYIDALSDANLTDNALMDFPDLPIPAPPFASVICEHQGRMLVATGVSPYEGVNPSTDVYYEHDPNFLEGFNALASIRIPSTTKSSITCLHSDNENMLAIFKEDSYFNIVGEIGVDGNYQVITVSDGDIGCPSPHSIQKINALGGSIFLSNRGFALLSGGRIDESIGFRTRLAFQDISFDRGVGSPSELVAIAPNQDKIIPFKAMSINHNIDGKYICYVPSYNGFWGALAYEWTASRCFVYDYRYNKWGEYNRYFRGNGGYAMYNNKLHALGVFTVYKYPNYSGTFGGVAGLYRELNKEVNNYNGTSYVAQFQYDYADGTFPIENVYKTTALHLGTPSLMKQFLACKLYQLATAITAFSLRLKTYRNFGTSVHSDVTYDFETTTTEKTKDIKKTNSRVLAFEFSNTAIHECPMLSGYEIEAELDYEEENLENR